MTITATWNDSPTSPGYDIVVDTTVITNPGFEVNLSGWTSINAASIVRSTAQAASGVASCFVTPSGSGVVARVETDSPQWLPVVPGSKVTVSGWIRLQTSNKPAVTQITWRDSGGGFLSSTVFTGTTVPNAWQQVSGTGTAPANSAFACVASGIGSTPAAGDTAYVDDLSIQLADTSYMKILRRDLSGFLGDSDVRKAGSTPDGFVPITGSAVTITSDYEFSFNTNIRYLYEHYNSNKVLTRTEQVDVGSPPLPTTAYYGHAWLKDVLTPSNSQPIIVGEFRGYTREPRVTLIDVLNRQNPVPITDVLAGKNGSFTFYAMDTNFGGTLPTVDQYNALFNSGQILFFQSLSPQTVGWHDSYLVVTSIEFERLSLPYNPAETIFKYTIGFTEVSKPLTNSIDISLQTWQQVLDNHDDWQDVLNSHSTWLDVYQDPQDLN